MRTFEQFLSEESKVPTYWTRELGEKNISLNGQNVNNGLESLVQSIYGRATQCPKFMESEIKAPANQFMKFSYGFKEAESFFEVNGERVTKKCIEDIMTTYGLEESDDVYALPFDRGYIVWDEKCDEYLFYKNKRHFQSEFQ